MSKKVAIQMDAIESIHINSDTTYVLGLEAQRRGHELYYYQPVNMSLQNGHVVAFGCKITLHEDRGNYFTLHDEIELNLAEMDIIMMRQDPPFDMNYLTYTYMLEKLPSSVLIVNNPAEVRNCPEKLFVCDFAEYTPKTTISSNKKTLLKFFEKHADVIIKPLYSFAGNDVFRATIDNADEIIDTMLKKEGTPIIIQEYLPAIAQGDKRIMLINGEFAGALNRIPAEGQVRSNLAQGGTAKPTELTAREIEICNRLGPELRKRGLLVAGIDVIGGYLTEINVTSPTGFQAINRLYNIRLEEKFWDAVEEIL